MSYVARLLTQIVETRFNPQHRALRDEYFEAFEQQWRFIKDYNRQNFEPPSHGTFETQFPDFEFEYSEASVEWLADEVKQECIHMKLTADMVAWGELAAVNPMQAMLEITKMQP